MKKEVVEVILRGLNSHKSLIRSLTKALFRHALETFPDCMTVSSGHPAMARPFPTFVALLKFHLEVRL